MNLKLLVLTCVVIQVVEVKSECDDYLKCISDFITGSFVDNHNGTFVEDINNNSFIITEEDGKQNTSVNYFEIKDLEKSLETVLSDVTSLIQKEIENNLKIISESDIFKTIENKTDIYVKTYDLHKENKETKVANESEIDIQTKFNITDNVKSEEAKDITQDPMVLTDNGSALELTTIKATDVDTKIGFETSESNLKSKAENKVIQNIIPTTSATVYSTVKATTLVGTKTNIDSKEENKNFTTIPPKIYTEVTIISTKIPENIKTEADYNNSEKKFGSTDDKMDLITNIFKDLATERIKKESTTTEKNKVIYNITKVKEFNDIVNVKENEISNDNYELDYELEDDNATDYPVIDYIDLYKDTTNDIVNYVPTEIPTNTINDVKTDLDNVIEYTLMNMLGNETGDNTAYTNSRSHNDTHDVIIPWIATIFIKNGSTNQFEYFCDGALLSERVVLTAARCVIADTTMNAENFIIILGKRSLIAATQDERVLKVKKLILHDNFTKESGENDLAALLLDEPAEFSAAIQPACLDNGPIDPGVTTGWAVNGNLTAISLDQDNQACLKKSFGSTFCASYGNDVTTCPSYGGIYTDKQTYKCVKGLRTGDPTDRGFCIHRTVYYTSLKYYTEWIHEIIELNKD